MSLAGIRVTLASGQKILLGDEDGTRIQQAILRGPRGLTVNVGHEGREMFICVDLVESVEWMAAVASPMRVAPAPGLVERLEGKA